MQNNELYSLFVLATPIGNLADISERALDTLRKVDLILCEDTRTSGKLLSSYGIKNKTKSLHKFNEKDVCRTLDLLFNEHSDIALISDAGTPAISDPGSLVVNYCLSNNVKVVPVPGVSALASIISVSGILSQEITFVGFLPHTDSKKQKLFNEYKYKFKTIVFFDSAKRIENTINIIAQEYPNSTVVLGREMTKIHEQILKFKIVDYANYSERINKRGEFTVLLYQERLQVKDKELSQSLKKELAEYLNIDNKTAYKLLVELRERF